MIELTDYWGIKLFLNPLYIVSVHESDAEGCIHIYTVDSPNKPFKVKADLLQFIELITKGDLTSFK